MTMFSPTKANASRFAIFLCSLVALGSTASCASAPSGDPTSNADPTDDESDVGGDDADESADGMDTDGAFSSYEDEPNQSMPEEDEALGELETVEDTEFVGDDVEVSAEEAAALENVQGVGKKSGHAPGWTRPLANYRLTQGFRSSHNGIDLAKPYGSIVYAARAGRVTEIIRGSCRKGYRCVGTGKNWAVGKYGMSGDRIVVTHSNRTKTIYNHTGAAGLSYVGKVVRPDTPIGRLNRTGNRSGAHLHFTVVVRGKYVNPRNYIRF